MRSESIGLNRRRSGLLDPNRTAGSVPRPRTVGYTISLVRMWGDGRRRIPGRPDPREVGGYNDRTSRSSRQLALQNAFSSGTPAPNTRCDLRSVCWPTVTPKTTAPENGLHDRSPYVLCELFSRSCEGSRVVLYKATQFAGRLRSWSPVELTPTPA